MLRNPRVQAGGDAALAFALAATSLLGVLSGDVSWGKPKALAVVLALASTAPVAWRARRPLTPPLWIVTHRNAPTPACR